MEVNFDRLDFDKMGGLVPVVVKSLINGEILMLGFANEEAVRRTVETGFAHFYSRTRRKLWMKGETSGNVLKVLRIRVDCDLDSLIYEVVPSGPTCHTGKWSCFHNDLVYSAKWDILWDLLVHTFSRAVIQRRKGVGVDGDYLYVINPITDSIPPANPLLVSLMADYLLNQVNYRELNKLVTPEALGLPLGSVMAYKASLPLAVVRKRSYGIEGMEVDYSSGYEDGKYYLYGLEEGDSLLLVDDALSTGGTALSIINALERANIEIKGIAVAVNKPQYGGEDKLKGLGYTVKRVVDLMVWSDGDIEISHGSRRARLKVPVLEYR